MKRCLFVLSLMIFIMSAGDVKAESGYTLLPGNASSNPYSLGTSNTVTPSKAPSRAGNNVKTNKPQTSTPAAYTKYNMSAEFSYGAENQTLPINMQTEDTLALVNEIGNDIIRKNGIKKKIQFIVSEQPVANATTNLHNTIDVYTGLLGYCENKDELAFIIGHELGHAAKSHVAKSIGIRAAKFVATDVGRDVITKYVGGAVSRRAARIALDYGGDAVESKLSRGQEKDADLLGIDFIVKAGYNPLAGISIMNKIGSNYADFWKDHPSTDKRIITMYKYVKKEYPQFLEKGFNSDSFRSAAEKYNLR